MCNNCTRVYTNFNREYKENNIAVQIKQIKEKFKWMIETNNLSEFRINKLGNKDLVIFNGNKFKIPISMISNLNKLLNEYVPTYLQTMDIIDD